MKKLGFGLMRLPCKDGNISKIDHQRVNGLIDRFMADGFNYFDTAACYHNEKSEEAFRICVSERYPRESYWLTDKLSLFMLKKADEIPSFFERQLETLGVDYVDLYLLHSMRKSSFEQAEEWGAIDFMQKEKAKGRIKHIGFSFHDTAEVLDSILTRHPEMEYVQLQINYLDWEDEKVQSRKCYEVAFKHGKKVLIMEPVKGGALANIPTDAAKLLSALDEKMSVASWAIRFAASLPNVETVLSGMSNEEQLNDNLSYMKDFIPLTQNEHNSALKAAEIIRKTIAVPCTNCQYCVEGCPQQIDIPKLFTIFNNYMRFNGMNKQDYVIRYAQAVKDKGEASDCIGCANCEDRCPQKITIRHFLSQIAKEFEC
ncbi:MAG: aldo/keto reductase [Clostridia bacterium]|nr:aldo/keto reductase [Clostridia bacterium]